MIPPSKINLDDLLYSLPTISNELPRTVRHRWWRWQRPLVLHEDDWRQIEFIGSDLRSDLELELSEVGRVREEAVKDTEGHPVGFRRIHVRERILKPLESRRISVRDLKALGRQIAGVAVCSSTDRVERGFARRFGDGIAAYGLASGTIVTHLCLQPRCDGRPDNDTVNAIRSFAGKHDLLCVNWIRAASFAPVDGLFDRLL